MGNERITKKDLLQMSKSDPHFLQNLLFSAAESGVVNVVKMCVDCGALIVLKEALFDVDETKKNNGPILKGKYSDVIEEEELEFVDSAMHLAATGNHHRVIKFLIGLGADVNILDHNLSSPLHLAAQNNGVEAMKLLVKSGANIFAQDDYENTPLHIAAESDSVEAVKYLLRMGAKSDTPNYFNDTPVGVAKNNVLKLFVDKGYASELFVEDKLLFSDDALEDILKNLK